MASAGCQGTGSQGMAAVTVPAEITWLIEDELTGQVIARFCGNVALDVGVRELVRLFVGQSTQPYNASSTIGVGDSNAPADRAQTGLLGTLQSFKELNPGFPQIATDGFTVTFQSTFGSTEANFNWQEFCVRSPGNVAFNRRTQNVGTKTGGSWRVSVVIRFAGA